MIRIANISGFYGDRLSAMREMLDGGDVDVLTGDYLAELTMLILGRQRMKDPSAGYAKTFLKQAQECLGDVLDRGVRIVVNAGGLNPAGLADAVRALGFPARVAHVEGDDLLPRAAALGLTNALTANAYLGAWGIAACLRAGADVVVTGRVTDASLVVGAAAAHHNWTPTDYDALAGATAAGHVIECGTQATGGNFAFFTEIPSLDHPGFPIAEVHADGSSVITKHPGTGGAVTPETVTAQLLYEIQGTAYLGPDVTTHFNTLHLTPDGNDRVHISGARGTPPPPDLKVCVNTLDGFRNSATFVLTGLDIDAKAALVRRQLGDDITWTLARTDHEDADTEETASALLHATIRTPDPARAKSFSRAAVELALASYPGFTLTAPPTDGTPVGIYHPAYVPRPEVPHTAIHPDGTRENIPWPTHPDPHPANNHHTDDLAPAAAPPSTTPPTADPPSARSAEHPHPVTHPLSAGSGEHSNPRTHPLSTQSGEHTHPGTHPHSTQSGEHTHPGTHPHSTQSGEHTNPETLPPSTQPDQLPTPQTSFTATPHSTQTAPATPWGDGPWPVYRGQGGAEGVTDRLWTTSTPSAGTVRKPLGRIAGARSGDKGGDANLGVWVRDSRAYPWLIEHLTVARLKELLPEAADLDIDRFEFPNLNAVNFVLRGLLGQGVAASTRFDPQAKGLGEWLRSRHVDIPEELL